MLVLEAWASRAASCHSQPLRTTAQGRHPLKEDVQSDTVRKSGDNSAANDLIKAGRRDLPELHYFNFNLELESRTENWFVMLQISEQHANKTHFPLGQISDDVRYVLEIYSGERVANVNWKKRKKTTTCAKATYGCACTHRQ